MGINYSYITKTNWEEKMLYKNKIKVQNILKSAVALMLMLTLSLSTALSPLAKAESKVHVEDFNVSASY